MPWYKIELNVGISDQLAKYIVETYGGEGHQHMYSFERQGNYTKIIGFANSQGQVNNAVQDIRTRMIVVEETTPPT